MCVFFILSIVLDFDKLLHDSNSHQSISGYLQDIKKPVIGRNEHPDCIYIDSDILKQSWYSFSSCYPYQSLYQIRWDMNSPFERWIKNFLLRESIVQV